MVRIEVKHGDGKEFLYDCLSTSPVDDIASEIIRISNLQSKINCLSLQLEPRLIPLSGDSNATSPYISLFRALEEAKSYASKDQVLHNRPLSYHVLRDHLQAIEKEFMEIYQFLGFTDSAEFHQLLMGMELLQEGTTKLWWAGKELDRSTRLCDYIGRNEKTKIVIRLQSADSHNE
ncbi:hypothetical protein SLEP1_g37565 [Rubroshorea leprosula]|uniref:Uncharacterized protein n=2 Tax=Rubroshorea leprosula TaxID=152421 RepID=A0AAV5KV39_9ROSI|nr:hypothetical protein SLEP1_g37565 [Rubroshorea leprosula]